MDKANIIISIIVVLCIAAAVAAYGITNSNNPIFSDLSSMDANDDINGLGNNTTLTNGTNTTTMTTSGSSVSSGSSSSSSGSSSSSSGSSSSSATKAKMSYSTAKSIATGAILEKGCYAGSGYYSNGYWYFTIDNSTGSAVDGIAVNAVTGHTDRA